MELFPFAGQNVASYVCLGVLHDTDVPANGERGIHSTFNDALAVRLFTRTPMSTAPYRWQYSPLTNVNFNGANFHPAWIEIDPSVVSGWGYNASISAMTRIVPKVRLPALDARNASTQSYYNEAVATSILAHKMGAATPVFMTGVMNAIAPQYNLTQEGWYLDAEYDFGAEIELKGLVGFSVGSAVASMMTLGTQQTYLQAFVNNAWVDVIHTYDSLRTTSNWSPVQFVLPTSVKAQKFRVVNKATTYPWTSGHYPYSLQFYANYTGTKPRTLGKYKHLSIVTLYSGASYSNSAQWTFNWPAVAATVLSRYFAMTHFNVTDDLKLSASFDIVMNDASYSRQYGEVPVPTFRIKQDAIVGRGV